MFDYQSYIELVERFPQYYQDSKLLRIVLDQAEIENFMKINHKVIGIITESPYFYIVTDLVESVDGRKYPYTRIINKSAYNGVVILPKYGEQYVLLKQFRHGPRNFEYELPRGFSETALNPEDNAKKEVLEELGSEGRNFEYLGSY